jgi:metal transporter CNNM
MPSLSDGSTPRVLSPVTEEEEIFVTWNVLGALLCVAFVALIAGLFLGLLTLDTLDLRIIQRASMDEDERLYATVLLPVVEQRHLVLVTLLLMNALAYETLPIFLDNLVPSWVAILLSSTIVLLFGEIVPSGIFMGPNQLYLGYKMVPLMKFFLWSLYPLAAPLAALLDRLTYDEHEGESSYNRGELSALVRIQHEEQLGRRGGRLSRAMKRDRSKDQTWAALKAEIMERVREEEVGGGDEEAHLPDLEEQMLPPLHQREVDLVEGALQMKTCHAGDVYTPHSHVYSVPDNLVLDKATITSIYSHGYSRVPVYHKEKRSTSSGTEEEEDPNEKLAVLGFLVTRQLMLIDWDDMRELSTLPLQRPVCVSPRTNLIDLFDNLQRHRPLMTFVCARPDVANKALQAHKPIPLEAGYMGIVTLVDVMESILQDRIYDEEDIRDRDRAVATLTRWAGEKIQSFMRRSALRKKEERLRQEANGDGGKMGTAGPSSSVTSSTSSSEKQWSKRQENEQTPLLRHGDKSERKLPYNSGYSC